MTKRAQQLTCSITDRAYRRVASAAVWFLLSFISAARAEDGGCRITAARLVSAEGDVVVTRQGAAARAVLASAGGAEPPICASDEIRVGERSRAAILLVPDGQVVRLNEKTTLRLLGESSKGRPFLSLIRGLMRLFSPTGRPLDAETPYVTAGVEGTEFYLSYDEGNAQSLIGVIDGHVRATVKAAPSISREISRNEILSTFRSGPFTQIRPVPDDDKVRWAIFYPPALWNLGGKEQERLEPPVAEAWNAWTAGDTRRAVELLGNVRGQRLGPASLIRAAAILLSVGRADEAERYLAQAEAQRKETSRVAALRAIIAIAQNHREAARRQSDIATQAAKSDAEAWTAAIARSYLLQATGQIDEAAEALRPFSASGSAIVAARLAELELSRGYARAARQAATAAEAEAPALSRPLSIQGFAAMADFDDAVALNAFKQAAARDPGDPLPRIGLGLLAIRHGKIEEGRTQLAIAVALDPESATARSYLGRAYTVEDRFPPAFREWSLAEDADRNDPTAPLYRAMAERSLNRPVEALRDLETSIDLNGARAPYRSTLLLDQDLATRSTGLASVYRDLGFEEAALLEGARSVTIDPANSGAHRFLSDSYLALPRHEEASDSELLQSLLLQPLNVEPLRPRLSQEGLGILSLRGPAHIGYNEFSPAFASDGMHVLTDVFGGSHNTFGENGVAYGIQDNVSYSVGQFYYRTDGIRPNNDLQRRVQDVFIQPALNDQVSVFGEFRHSDLTSGDTSQLFDGNNFLPAERQATDLLQYRLGGHYDVTPGVTLVGVWTRGRVSGFVDTGEGVSLRETQIGDLGETSGYFSLGRLNLVAGGGIFQGHQAVSETISNIGTFPVTDSDTRHVTGWLYGTLKPVDPLRLIMGLSWDDFSSTFFSRKHLNPKLGAMWDILNGTTLRAAYFQTFKRTTVDGQTIEPTQIAGFNQLFDDGAGTLARRMGIGLDQKIKATAFGDFYGGVEYSTRRLEVPLIPTAPESATIVQPWKEGVARGYVSWAPMPQIAINFEVQWERFKRDPLAQNVGQFTDLSLLRLPLELRWFNPSGAIALLRTSYIFERGNFQDQTGTLFNGVSHFMVVDAGVGWRIPGRPAVATLEIDNILNRRFRFQDTDPTNTRVVPARQVLARVTVVF